MCHASRTLTSATKSADSEIKLRITSAGVYEAFTAMWFGGGDGGGDGDDFRRAICETLRLAVISSVASSRKETPTTGERGFEMTRLRDDL